MERINKVITFMGPSGIGKTTLAKYISEKYGLPFITGSYSDLIPSTRAMPHQKMLELPPADVLKMDLQLLRARVNSYRQHRKNGMVSDRSPLDVLAYSIIKLSSRVKTCDLDPVWDMAFDGMMYVDALIYMPFGYDDFKEWDVEDNNKRVLNKYFQAMVSSTMNAIFNRIPAKLYHTLVLPVGSLETRQLMIDNFMDELR